LTGCGAVRSRRVLAGACALVVAALWPAPLRSQVAVTVDPPRLEVSTFSGQREVRISASVAAAAQAVVVVRARGAEAVFNRKVRVGPIWLNSGRVHITGAPSLCLSFAPARLESLLRRQDVDEHQLDARAIREHLRIEPAEADQPVIRDSYLALKIDDGSYRFVESGEGAVQPGEVPGSYGVVLAWPMTAPPATYDVTVYECLGGRVTGVGTTALEVVEVGLAAWLASAAMNHPSFYGAVAVGVTISLGFGIDALASFLRRRIGGRGGSAASHANEHLRAH
jgi:hypothetical protein